MINVHFGETKYDKMIRATAVHYEHLLIEETLDCKSKETLVFLDNDKNNNLN